MTDEHDRIYRNEEGFWWHNDHPLEPDQDCCNVALEELLEVEKRYREELGLIPGE